jgi:hypothetical protein
VRRRFRRNELSFKDEALKAGRKQGEEMAAQVVSRKEIVQKEQIAFQQILSNLQLAILLTKLSGSK